MSYQLHQGDCLETLRGMADNSVDSIVTDPPYGLAFMGKKWDYDVPKVGVWEECLRVLKPGGHLLAFAGTRTQHRMAVRIEDAGFEIRDMIFWCYASGFPKSLDVSKAIDKAAGVERTEFVKSTDPRHKSGSATNFHGDKGATGTLGKYPPGFEYSKPATEAARQWQGWGTALKPALEPITLARKPLGSTVAECVLAHGTGALNIDGCRVGEGVLRNTGSGKRDREDGWGMQGGVMGGSDAGRWPANLIHDGSPEVLAGFPEVKPHGKPAETSTMGGVFGNSKAVGSLNQFTDTGSAARFFYTAKASQEDRDAGLHGFEKTITLVGAEGHKTNPTTGRPVVDVPSANTHPTVKPTDLMRYLVRLVTPPGGTVLDPFNGSGSTGKACMLEGFAYIGCELDPAYIEISRARIEHAIALRASGAEKLHPASERDDKTIDLFSGANE